MDRATNFVLQPANYLGKAVSSPIILQYLQRNYHIVKPASQVLALSYFDQYRKHVQGGTGWSVAMAQLMNKPVHVYNPIYEEWNWWNQTTRQWEQCEDMRENYIPIPRLQDHTAIVNVNLHQKFG